MDVLEKYVDHYAINARLKPAFFVVMPLAVTTLAWCPEAQQVGGIILAFLITFGVMAFLSNLVSNQGNKLQIALYELWGGVPTTLLLRHSDSTLDEYTKQRYHQWLETKVTGLKFPAAKDEESKAARSDQCYASAVNFLREYTRDKTKYPMVYADNVAYGFARNLLVMRWIGVGFSVVGILLNFLFLYSRYEGPSLRGFVNENMAMILFGGGATITSIIILFVWIFFVHKEYVKGRAIRYAKSLLAVCEEELNPP